MAEMGEIRKFVSDRYDGASWKRRVAFMPDSQVYAIFCSLQKRDIKKAREKKENGTVNEAPLKPKKEKKQKGEYVQMTIFDYQKALKAQSQNPK